MATLASEHILLVENNPEISNLITRQVLEPLGYKVFIAENVNAAIKSVARTAPDLVIADLNLPGLSGKDLLVALNSQGVSAPLIVIAREGQEDQVIQAFRLGGTDFLVWPVDETEVAAAVERALKQVRDSRARQHLDQQLKETNTELQRRVRELTTIYAVSKAVISITDQRVLLDKIVEGMVYVAEGDYGWLQLRDERSLTFTLASHRNLPETWAKKMGHPLEDGISSMVALSGETLAINGEPLKRFRAGELGNSAVVVPIKIRLEVVGLLVVVRKADMVFDRNMQTLLEAVGDYASVSLVNARLFRVLQENLESTQAGERSKLEQLMSLQRDLRSLFQPVIYQLDLCLTGKMGILSDEQKLVLGNTQSAVQRALTLTAKERVSQPLSTG